MINMNTQHLTLFTRCTLGLLTASLALPLLAADAPKRVLVVSVTAGFRHTEGIDASEKILPKIAQESGAFTLDWCRHPQPPPNRPGALKPDATDAAREKYKEALARWEQEIAQYEAEGGNMQARMRKALEKLSPDNLKNYDLVIFNNTTGELPLPDREGFLKWIENGGGFIGIHAATDTYHNFRPFIAMIGAEFATHGAQATVDIINQDPQHPSSKPITDSPWVVHDEIYLVKNFDRKKVHGLLTLDKHPNTKAPGDYPIAWCSLYGKGRVLYTSLGHRADVWDDDPNIRGRKNSPEVARAHQKHILGSIKWALGLEPGDATPQVK